MKILAAAAVALAALAAPAAAAPTIAPLKPCYVYAGVDPATGRYDSELVDIAASGFAPWTRLRVVVDGTTIASGVQADATGTLRVQAQAPVQEDGERDFTVTVADEADAANAATAVSRVAFLEVTVAPRKARPTSRVRFRGRGFTDLGASVFGHYVRRGRHRRTVRLVVRPEGACGTFSVRRRQFPFRRPRVGRWHLYVDQSRVFRTDLPSPQADLEILVRRSLRLGSRRG